MWGGRGVGVGVGEGVGVGVGVIACRRVASVTELPEMTPARSLCVYLRRVVNCDAAAVQSRRRRTNTIKRMILKTLQAGTQLNARTAHTSMGVSSRNWCR
jgi:hypothetical protein